MQEEEFMRSLGDVNEAFSHDGLSSDVFFIFNIAITFLCVSTLRARYLKIFSRF